MDFVCLAAGRGTRFGTLGSYLQKAMYPIGLRPFAAYAVRNLLQGGAFDPNEDRLAFVIGHLGHQVRAYFGHAHLGVPVTYVEQAEPLGTGHAVHLAANALRPTGPTVFWLGDTYVASDIFRRLRAHPEENALTVARDVHGDNPDVQVTIEADRLTRVWRGSGPHADIGIWKLAPAVIDAMLDRRAEEFRALAGVQRSIESGTRVGWVEAAEWIHLGGTAPTPDANVRAVVRRVLELEAPP